MFNVKNKLRDSYFYVFYKARLILKCLKGLCHQLNICWKPIQLNQYFYMHILVFKFFACLVQKKNFILSFWLFFENTTFNNCSVSRMKFLFWLSFALIGRFYPVYFHSRLSKQFSGSQAAFRKPEQAILRGLLEGISKLLCDFIEAKAET